MSDGGTNAKPRRAGRGFAQSTWWLVAFPLYRIGLAGANACLPFCLSPWMARDMALLCFGEGCND